MQWRERSVKRSPSGFIAPSIPTISRMAPQGGQWIHEIKHDGYRLLVRKTDSQVRIFTRQGYDWSDRYPRITKAVSLLNATSAYIDGEVVVCDPTGLASFERLHSRKHDAEAFLY